MSDRIRAGFGRRAAGIFLALLVEVLLALLLFTLAPSTSPREEVEETVFSFAPEPAEVPAPEPAPDPPEPEPSEPRPAERVPPPPEPASAAAPRVEPQPAPPPPAFIPLSRAQMAAADIAAMPAPPAPRRAPSGPVYGPPAPPASASSDTPRVDGSGPNGEPLYAAAWYRKPYDDELSGFLSTARGPGWGLIACRTVAEYRVEDCVAVGEYPEGSNIARAVLAAAWQFRVRPPRIGGRSKIGEWVRIRIDYELRRR